MARSEGGDPYGGLMDLLPDAAFVHAGEVIVYANDSAAVLFGATGREELVGRGIADLIHPASLEAVAGRDRQVRADGRAPSLDARIIRFDGREVDVEGRGVSVPSEGETGILVVLRDISARVETEASLRESERMALETLEKLRTTQTSLVQAEKLAAVGELVAGVAHEINNPLSSVVGYSELLLRLNLDSQARQHVQAIVDDATRIAGIVQNLLSFAKGQEHQASLVDMATVIQRAMEIKAYDLRVNNIGVETKVGDDVAKVMGNASHIQSVVLNLINNAQDAMTEAHGGGNLKIRTAQVGNWVRLTISDDGPGIDPEHIQRIFIPFFTTKDVGRSTGLGLSICHGIVAEHNGRIWVESEPGHGATFNVEFPAMVVEELAQETTEAPAPQRFAAAGRILVVDDEAGIRELIKATLEDQGHEVDTASGGLEALVSLEKAEYDMLLLDLKMPGLDGRAVYAQILSWSPEIAARVTFISGDTVSQDAHDSLEDCGRPVIDKPFHLEDLINRVARELSKRTPD